MYLLTSEIRQGSEPGPVLSVGGTNPIAARINNYKKKFFADDKDFYLDGEVNQLPTIIKEINYALQNAADESVRMK